MLFDLRYWCCSLCWCVYLYYVDFCLYYWLYFFWFFFCFCGSVVFYGGVEGVLGVGV